MLLVVAATELELRSLGDVAEAGAEVLVCGVGPVDAAARVAARLAASPAVVAVLHVGIAGARRAADIEPGSLVIGDASHYGDTASTWVLRQLQPDPALVVTLRAALPGALVLSIGTSADVGGSVDCDVEAMEGFGVLRAAELAGVPAVELRAVSNVIEEPDRAVWRFDLALDALAQALPVCVSALSRR